MQEVIKKYNANEITYHQVQDNCKGTYNMINSLIMKEWLLLTKMNSILEMKSNNCPAQPTPSTSSCTCNRCNQIPYNQIPCNQPNNF